MKPIKTILKGLISLQFGNELQLTQKIKQERPSSARPGGYVRRSCRAHAGNQPWRRPGPVPVAGTMKQESAAQNTPPPRTTAAPKRCGFPGTAPWCGGPTSPTATAVWASCTATAATSGRETPSIGAATRCLVVW